MGKSFDMPFAEWSHSHGPSGWFRKLRSKSPPVGRSVSAYLDLDHLWSKQQTMHIKASDDEPERIATSLRDRVMDPEWWAWRVIRPSSLELQCWVISLWTQSNMRKGWLLDLVCLYRRLSLLEGAWKNTDQCTQCQNRGPIDLRSLKSSQTF